MAQRKVFALANPDVVRWAREAAGFAVWDAAENLGLPEERLEAIERGQERFTFPQLRAAAALYKRSICVFYLAAPPDEARPVADFRRVPESEDRPISPELLLAMRRLAYKREAAVRLIDFAAPYDWSYVNSLQPGGNPEQVAAELRAALRVPPPVSLRDYDVLKVWRSAVEARGTLVFLVRNVDVDEMRGMAIGQRPFPVIALNRSDSPRGRLFSLVHEYVHVCLGTSSMCDDFTQDRPSKNEHEVDEIETFCNAVAAAILMPAETVRRARQVRGHRRGTDWTEADLVDLALPFGVSAEAMLRRLLTLKLATKENYVRLRRAWRSRRPPSARDGREGGERGDVTALRTQSLPYVRLVLDALGGEAIELADVPDLLDMKLNHLRDLEAAVAAG